MIRIIPLCAGLVLLGLGCTPQASFQPETLEIGQDKLIIKGWTRSEQFCIELRLDSAQRALYLHNVNLISADGQKRAPDKWENKTPKPPTIGVSVGMGFGLGGGGHTDPHTGHTDGGGGTSIVPAVGVPLKLGPDRKGITAIEACWKVSKNKSSSPVTDCTLEVNLSSIQPDKIEVTTVSLAMAHHEDEEDASTEQQEDPKSAKDVVREIDFTLKGPAKTKTIAT